MKQKFRLLPLSIVILGLVVSTTTVAQTARLHPGAKRYAQNASGADNGLEYTTSWIGNTFGGNSTGPDMDMRHVVLDMNDIYVTSDGRVFTNTGWDEGGRPVSIFKDGNLISPLSNANNSPNWSNAGGSAIAVDGNYIYAAQSTGVGATPPCAGDAPGNGCGINILDAKTMVNTGLAFSDSSLYLEGNILGMVASRGKLYVTEWDYNQVAVYDLATLSLSNEFAVTNPVRIAVDSAGGIWVSHRNPGPDPATAAGNVYDINEERGLARIDHYDADGHWLNALYLPKGGEVGAIHITAEDTMLVADNGPDLNVKIYANISTAPILAGTFGEKGGVYAGPVPGQTGPMRFRGMTGIGTDRMGNIYISQSGAGLNLPGGESGHGVQLQSYSPWGSLNWEVHALDWISLGTPDPHSESNFYDAYHHYKMDYSQPPGKEATLVADTHDRFLYPNDIRVTNPNGASRGEIHYINGHKFLFVVPQDAVWMAIYRFDVDQNGSEIPVPCGGFDYGSAGGGAWQDWAIQPLNGEFIWRDLKGDGQMASGDFLEPPNDLHRDGDNFFVDTNGDVWQVNYQGEYPPYESSIHIRRYLFQGLDQFGSPIYDFKHMMIYSVPTDFPDFTTVGNMVFQPNSEGGTLYVWGSGVVDGVSAPVMARYDNWDKGNRKARWVTDIPWNDADWLPSGFTVAGNFVFVDYWAAHYNSVYDATTGVWLGQFTPGNDVGGPTVVGNTDMSEPNFAYQRKNGEILLFQEEDYQSKILMYRWTPPSTLPNLPPPPAVPTGLTVSAADDETVTINWPLATDPNVIGYTFSYSPTSGGPYTVFAAGLTSGPQQLIFQKNGSWYFVLNTMSNSGQVSSDSAELAASTKPYGTTYEAEAGVLQGDCVGIYAGSENSAGFRVGCIDQSTTITINNVSVPTTGTYAMRIYYGNGDSNPADLYSMGAVVNGASIQYSPNMPYTGDWSIPGYVTMNVQLNAGNNNTIVLENPINGGPDTDRIVIPNSPVQQ